MRPLPLLFLASVCWADPAPDYSKFLESSATDSHDVLPVPQADSLKPFAQATAAKSVKAQPKPAPVEKNRTPIANPDSDSVAVVESTSHAVDSGKGKSEALPGETHPAQTANNTVHASDSAKVAAHAADTMKIIANTADTAKAKAEVHSVKAVKSKPEKTVRDTVMANPEVHAAEVAKTDAQGADTAKDTQEVKPRVAAKPKANSTKVAKAKENVVDTANGKAEVHTAEVVKVKAHAVDPAKGKAEAHPVAAAKPKAHASDTAKGKAAAHPAESVKADHAEPAKSEHQATARGAAGDTAKKNGTKPTKTTSAPVEKSHHEAAKPSESHSEEKAAHDEHGASEKHEEEEEQHEPMPTPKDTDKGKGETPQMSPKPDTAFARAGDWENGLAEVLSYTVTRRGRVGPIQCKGSMVTERMYLRPDGSAARKPGSKGEADILNTAITVSGEDEGVPFALETLVKVPRREHLRLLRQDQSLQSWPGSTYRILDCGVSPPRLRVMSSGGETVRDTLIERWPVYTEEMLFTYLRSVPQRAGYREEVWLQDWSAEGRFAIQPQFAAISVRSMAPAIRDMETWYITVDREDGRRSEFWVSAAALHPVVLAQLVDRSTWTLQEITRKKYWAR